MHIRCQASSSWSSVEPDEGLGLESSFNGIWMYVIIQRNACDALNDPFTTLPNQSEITYQAATVHPAGSRSLLEWVDRESTAVTATWS